MPGIEDSFLILNKNFKDFFEAKKDSINLSNHKESLENLQSVRKNVVHSHCNQLISLQSFRNFVRLSHRFLATWCREQPTEHADICIELVRCLYNITNVGKLHGRLDGGVEKAGGLVTGRDCNHSEEAQKKKQWQKLLRNKKIFYCIIKLILRSNEKQINSLSIAWLYINMLDNSNHHTNGDNTNEGESAKNDGEVCGGPEEINNNKSLLDLLNVDYEEEDDDYNDDDFHHNEDDDDEEEEEEEDNDDDDNIKRMALLVEKLIEMLMVEDGVDSEWSAYLLKLMLKTNEVMSVVCCLLPSQHVMFLLELVRDMMQEGKLMGDATTTDGYIRWITHTIQRNNHDRDVNKELWMCVCEFTCNKHKCFRHFLLHTLDNLKMRQEKESKNKDSKSNEDDSVLKRCMLQVVANLLHVVEGGCDLVRERNHINTILHCTNIDPLSPVSQQWALFAIHNLCVNNTANQNYISSLKLERQNDLTNQLRDVGLKVELVDGKIKFYSDSKR